MKNSSTRYLKTLTCLTLTSVLAGTMHSGCIAEGDSEKIDDSVEISVDADGKADGRGLIPAAQRDAILRAIDNVIADGNAAVASLEAEIAKLEEQNRFKAAEIDRLVAQISAREAELQDTYNRNLVLCAFLPSPSLCIFANVLSNDSALQEFHRQLEDARARQRQGQAESAGYQTKKARIRSDVEQLRRRRDDLRTRLTSGTTGETPPTILTRQALRSAYTSRSAFAKLSASFAQEISLLTALRDAAAELQTSLDAAIVKLNAVAVSVDRLVAKQQKQFIELLRQFLGGDASATARKWLDDELAKRTQLALSQLDVPTRSFVEQLLSHDGVASDQSLFNLLMAKLRNPSFPEVSNTTEQQIPDLGEVASLLDVPAASVTVGSVIIAVKIDHGWIGDLRITATHRGVAFPLQQLLGGSDKTLNKAFNVVLPPGDNGAGSWTLAVADVVKGDTGTLRQWSIALQ
jgi:predicted  nucleic acid-binding Zn-ribbon protein